MNLSFPIYKLQIFFSTFWRINVRKRLYTLYGFNKHSCYGYLQNHKKAQIQTDLLEFLMCLPNCLCLNLLLDTSHLPQSDTAWIRMLPCTRSAVRELVFVYSCQLHFFFYFGMLLDEVSREDSACLTFTPFLPCTKPTYVSLPSFYPTYSHGSLVQIVLPELFTLEGCRQLCIWS